MAVSSDRTSGDTILHGHFNDLRDDVFDITNGHIHGNTTDIGKGVYLRGTLAARPAAGQVGRVYKETDVGSEDVERDNGSAWESFIPVDAAVGVGSMRTLGSGSQQAAAGDHTHV